jgi:hypothetical protein
VPENPRDEMIKWLKGDESRPSETDRRRAAEEARAEREQAEQSKQIANGGLFLAIAAVLFIAWVSWPRSSSQTPRPSPMQDLRADAGCNPSGVYIKNRDSFAWKEMKVELNRRWFVRIRDSATPKPEQTEIYPFSIFQTSDGERFNPTTHACQSIDIHVDTLDGGRAHWNGSAR